MPAFVRKISGKFRVVHRTSGGNVAVVQNQGGKAADGGGHKSAGDAQRQARAINANTRK